MLHEPKNNLTPEDHEQVAESLLKGVISRAGLLSFVYAFMFAIYSVNSIDFLRVFKPDLTLFDNLWPRLVFNTLPCLAIGYYFRNYQSHVRLKAWIWTIGLPAIFAAACMVHVWPLMWTGSKNVYFYVHAPNAFIIATSLMVVSPPFRFLCAQIAAFCLFLVLPVAVMFLRLGDMPTLQWALGDFVICFGISMYCANMIFKLRRKIARFDHYMKKTASPFLGSALTQAIYQQNPDLLKDRKADAIIVKMDIRGYTDFYKSNDSKLVRQFMSGYHGIVSRNVGTTKGYWHKSIGDGQLASYGAMDSGQDLSDIPGIEDEMKSARLRKNAAHMQNVLKAITTIAFQFERLKEQFDVQEKLTLGIAVAAGEVEVRVQGDDMHKMELDIDGEVILRCSRLETYSKTVQGKIGHNGSVIILSPELIELADPRMFNRWPTVDADLQVRSYPEIKQVAYHAFRDSGERRGDITKLRAS